ncbi:MAG: RNA pyrophosphohydrolase [Myxococcales bacterium]|nr:RNA pyrophosphohydrolase [Myxococcales bacterium]
MTRRDDLPFRTNVGAILRRDDGLILMAERIHMRDTWQFPQGGVDKGEDLETAMWRELEEELGLSPPQDTCAIIAQGPAVRYVYPPELDIPIARRYAGQEQTLFLLRYTGGDDDFDLDFHRKPEFRAVRWLSPEAAVDLMWDIKRPVLVETLKALSEHL